VGGYTDEVRAASAAANAVRNNGRKIGPVQVQRVLKTRGDQGKTVDDLLKACGVKSQKALRDVAAGKGSTEPLRPLAKRVKDQHADAYAANPRWLASICVGVLEGLKS
jgi:hypothetical protein